MPHSTSSSPEPRASTDSVSSTYAGLRQTPSPEGKSSSPGKSNLSQLRDFISFLSTVKGDLSNVTAPPFVLSTKSVTELPATWAEHHSLFLAPAAEPDPALRALAVLKNFLCSLKRQTYTGRSESEGIKKPLNAFLGEVFLAKFAGLDGQGETRIISEQVSHHPPVTSCYLWNEKTGTRAEGCVAQNTTFSPSTGVQVRQMGHALITLDVPTSSTSQPQTTESDAAAQSSSKPTPQPPANTLSASASASASASNSSDSHEHTPHNGTHSAVLGGSNPPPSARPNLSRTSTQNSYSTPPQTPSASLADPLASTHISDPPPSTQKEYHILTLPTLIVRSLLTGRPYPELTGSCSVASSAGFNSTITFAGKTALGLAGTKNSLHATLADATGTPLFEVAGQWTGTLDFFDLRPAGPRRLLESVDVHTLPSQPADPVAPDPEQSPWESRKAWAAAVRGIEDGDMRATAGAKAAIENGQRALRKADAAAGRDRERTFARAFFTRDPEVTGPRPDAEERALRELADVVGLDLAAERRKTAGRWRFVGVEEAERRIADGWLRRDGVWPDGSEGPGGAAVDHAA